MIRRPQRRPIAMARTAAMGAALVISACGSPRQVADTWPDGKARRSGTMVRDQQQGTWTYHYASGAKQAEGGWKDDKQDGEWMAWHEDGSPRYRGAYASGLRTGFWRHWHPQPAAKDATVVNVAAPSPRLSSEGAFIRDRQHGLWRGFYANGRPCAAGMYDQGVRTGFWRTRYDNGKRKEEGLYVQGLKVGPWTGWNADGAATATDLGAPSGYLATTIAEDGGGRAWLLMRDGAPVAQVRWSSSGQPISAVVAGAGAIGEALESRQAWHANAVLQGAGFVQQDRKTGHWQYWHEQGAKAGEGDWTGGAATDLRGWNAEGRPLSPVASATVAGATVAADTSTSPAETDSLDAVIARADRRIADACALVPVPASVAAIPPEPARPEEPGVESRVGSAPVAIAAHPAQLDLALPDAQAPTLSPIPTLPQWWTSGEEANAKALITRYTVGDTAPVSGYDSYRTVRGGSGSFGGEGGRQKRDLIGKPLGQTRFLARDGSILDLQRYVGQKPLVLVVLRGFSGQVCLYCATQTAALSDQIKRFHDRGAEVVVIYPGPVESVPVFVEAVQTLRQDPPPMPLALDVSLMLVRSLGIEANLAKPTSLVIDRDGVVRYAYVGRTIADRPSVDDLLGEIARLDRPRFQEPRRDGTGGAGATRPRAEPREPAAQAPLRALEPIAPTAEAIQGDEPAAAVGPAR